MKYDWKAWIRAAGIRAIRTVAQTALASITCKLFTEVDWLMVGSASLLAGILSLLTSIAGLPELDQNPAAQIRQETEPPDPIE